MPVAFRWAGRARPGRLDVTVAALITLLAQGELLYLGLLNLADSVMSLLITGPLLWRRRLPILSALVVVGVFGLQALVFDPAPQVLGNGIAVLVAVYSVAACVGPLRAVPVLGVMVLSSVAFEADQGNAAQSVGDLVMAGGAWAVGWLVWRRAHAVDEQLAVAEEAVRWAAARADQALADERRRIARELHDVVSHAVTVVVLQARGGRAMMDRDPAQTRVALDAIEASGQEALAEMRRLVTLLREPSVDTTPQPGLGDLDALVAATAASGGDVALTVAGDAVTLSPGIELTAYRLVQECLTNAMRHASGTPARVALEYGRASLTLRVVNSGAPAPTPALTGGHGLLGMRERVELYGGTLDYGPGSSGWEVLGTLPYDEMLGSPPTDIRPRPASAMGE